MDDSFDLIGSKLDSQRISNKMTATALGNNGNDAAAAGGYTVTASPPSVVTNVTLSKGQSVNQTSSNATLTMATTPPAASMTPLLSSTMSFSLYYQYFVLLSYIMGPSRNARLENNCIPNFFALQAPATLQSVTVTWAASI